MCRSMMKERMKRQNNMENTIENARYRVRLENDKTPLFHGTIWECERWVSKNGVVGETYSIIRLKKKENNNERHKKA